jgi:gliding motility-associated-like protein
VQTFDAIATKDGGFVSTGIGKFSAGVYRPVVIKLDCKGKCLWSKNFDATSTIDNTMMRIIQLANGDVVMMNNLGAYNAYNILVVRINAAGVTLWKKEINKNAGNDIGQNMIETTDGNLIIVGTTNTYGTDAIGSNYQDVYAIKLDANGNQIWSTTIGNAAAIDQATAVAETPDGGFVMTGRYLTNGTFYAMLCKINNNGVVQFLKTFGAANHANYGLGITVGADSNILICGSTTLLQSNFQAYTDHFIIKCKPNGDTIWTRAYYGTNPNSFENAASILVTPNKQIVIAAATASYPTTGFVPNKQVLLTINPDGNLASAIGYNAGLSQYPHCKPVLDGSVLISGFTTFNSPTTFRPNLIKTTLNDLSFCNTIDYTAQTFVGYPSFQIATPSYTTATGAVISNYTNEGIFTMTDTTLCEMYPTITAAFTVNNTCAKTPIVFTSTTTNSAGYVWRFGNGDTAFTVAPSVTYAFANAGTYTVTLIVSNGCEKDSTTQVIQIGIVPNVQITQSPDPAKENDLVTLSVNLAATSFLWNTGAKTSSIIVTESGLYYVVVTVNGCIVTDTIQVNLQPKGAEGYIHIPSIITPNNDDLNDYLKIFLSPNYKLISLQVYNRLGNSVFTTTDIANTFKGIYNGQFLPNDVYFYHAVFKNGMVEVVKNGDITIIR